MTTSPTSRADATGATETQTLICYDDYGEQYHFVCASGFVSRVVSAIFHSDQIGCYADARRVMEIMNAAALSKDNEHG